MPADRVVDVAVLGGGGAGSALLLALDRAGLHHLAVVVVDPAPRPGARTWCWWQEGPTAVADAVSRSWDRARVVGPDAAPLDLDLAPYRYLMVRSADLYRLAEDAAARLRVRRLVAPADTVEDGPERALVVAGGERLGARWVFDSRPSPPRRPARTSLLQHFRGWVLRTDAGQPAFDPGSPLLMDFRSPQPAAGLSFGYVLPHDERTALVEYTEFSRSRLLSEAYDAALASYVRTLLGERTAYEVLEVEDGAIPMTDAGYARRVGRRVVRLGTAGGATRPSTGYTFAAIQRQVAAIVAALAAGRDPVPPPAYPWRHRAMDAALLQGLDRGLVDGPGFFAQLFASQPTDRVLRFLDGTSSPGEELSIMRGSPLGAMTRASAGALLAHLRAAPPAPLAPPPVGPRLSGRDAGPDAPTRT